MLILYHGGTSYASQKVRIYLAEKNLPWHSHHIDLRKQENITTDYRNINPKATIPALQDAEGDIHCDSTDIIEFLEWRYPSQSLSGESEFDRELIHKLCIDSELLHDPYLRMLSYATIFFSAEKRAQMDITSVLELAHQHPNVARGKFLERAAKGEFTDVELQACRDYIKCTLDKMEHYLQQNDGNFLVGKQYSIADAVGTTSIFRINQLGLQVTVQQYTRINAWYEKMQQRPSFKLALLDWLP